MKADAVLWRAAEGRVTLTAIIDTVTEGDTFILVTKQLEY